jgi:hypothetical protein
MKPAPLMVFCGMYGSCTSTRMPKAAQSRATRPPIRPKPTTSAGLAQVEGGRHRAAGPFQLARLAMVLEGAAGDVEHQHQRVLGHAGRIRRRA